MYHVVYTSSARRPFSTSELSDLLVTSRTNNRPRGLTGMLLYKDGTFMQVLEGERQAVEERIAVIENDPRHHGIIKLIQGEGERQFPDWSMGFRDLTSPDVREVEGYSEFMNAPLNAAAFSEDPTRAQRLLLMFRRVTER